MTSPNTAADLGERERERQAHAKKRKRKTTTATKKKQPTAGSSALNWEATEWEGTEGSSCWEQVFSSLSEFDSTLSAEFDAKPEQPPAAEAEKSKRALILPPPPPPRPMAPEQAVASSVRRAAIPPLVRVDVTGYGMVKTYAVTSPTMTFADLCKRVVETSPALERDPERGDYRIFLSETKAIEGEAERVAFHIPVDPSKRVLEHLLNFGSEVQTLLFKKPGTVPIRVVFHNGWKTIAAGETEKIGEFRAKVRERRLPTEDDHDHCRLHEHVFEAREKGDERGEDVPVDDDVFVSQLVRRWPSDPRERETHNLVYRVPKGVASSSLSSSSSFRNSSVPIPLLPTSPAVVVFAASNAPVPQDDEPPPLRPIHSQSISTSLVLEGVVGDTTSPVVIIRQKHKADLSSQKPQQKQPTPSRPAPPPPAQSKK